MKILKLTLQIFGILIITLIVTILLMAVWSFNQPLWNVLNLLLIPIVLTAGGYLLNRAQRRSERAIARNSEEERILSDYFAAMSDLLLEKGLQTSPEDSGVRSIARARTLTTLRNLSGYRKGSVIQFLYESKLIRVDNPILDLEKANLNDAHLVMFDLRGINLEQVFLVRANLEGANLGAANLKGAKLNEANLDCTNLGGADLSWANLSDANLSQTYLRGAELQRIKLTAATYNDDTVWPDDFNPQELGAVLSQD
ncbi:MAG: pentapeptide repeat-containing protein [Anaerolineae bacterium]|nr:pentapeptide repeat-containing protein [Anaerolineae bacterium]